MHLYPIAKRTEAHHYGLGSVALVALAAWGSYALLPDLVRYIRIMRM
jgi:hypothetical protein